MTVPLPRNYTKPMKTINSPNFVRGWDIVGDGFQLKVLPNDNLAGKIQEMTNEIQRQVLAHEEKMVLERLSTEALENLLYSCEDELKARVARRK